MKSIIFLLIPFVVHGKTLNEFKRLNLKTGSVDSARVYCEAQKGTEGSLMVEFLHKKESKGMNVIDSNWGCFKNKHQEDQAPGAYDVSAKVIRLTENIEALHIQSSFGGESISNKDTFITFIDNKPKVVWSKNYDTMESSSMDNYKVQYSFDEQRKLGKIDYYAPFITSNTFQIYSDRSFSEFNDDDFRIDRWTHELYEFDPIKNKMKKIAVQDYWVSIGVYSNLKDAYEIKFNLGKNDKCEIDKFLILPGETIDTQFTKKYVLVAIMPNESQANELAQRPKGCRDRSIGKVGKLKKV